jgi:hypothetical protein
MAWTFTTLQDTFIEKSEYVLNYHLLSNSKSVYVTFFPHCSVDNLQTSEQFIRFEMTSIFQLEIVWKSFTYTDYRTFFIDT